MFTDKSALRAYFRAERVSVSGAEKLAIDTAIAQRVIAYPLFLQAHTVFIYVATAEEIETRSIIGHAFAAGKTVCIPRCEARGEMTARRIHAANELVRNQKYGIQEPSADAPIVLPQQIDLILAPALACDRQGTRLGYGGGYYDRFLCQTDAVRSVLCAESRLVDTLPCAKHDIRCHLIFTERQVLRTDEK